MSDEPTITVPTSAPPPWFNTTMSVVLRTPGLQRIIGKGLVLLTVTGAKTGRRYTLPARYQWQDGQVVVITKAFRSWWKNLRSRSEVKVRLAGKVKQAMAVAHIAAESDLAAVKAFLEFRASDAKPYGLTPGPDGSLAEDEVRAILPQIVVIRIDVD
jgi:hypothetical protein